MGSNRAFNSALEQLSDAGFKVEETKNRKARIIHPKSGEVAWLKDNGGERHCRNFVRQLFRRHGIETEEDRSKRNNQAIKERRAEEAANRPAEPTPDEASTLDIIKMQNAQAAEHWHRDQGVESWRMTFHAAEAALNMGLAQDEIEDVYWNPTEAYWSTKHDAWTIRNDRLALGISIEDGVAVVLTVLWRHQEDWIADLTNFGLYGTREVKPDNYRRVG